MNFTQFVFNLSMVMFFIVFGIQIYRGYDLIYALFKGGIVFAGTLVLSFIFFSGLYIIFSMKSTNPPLDESKEKEVEQSDAANS